MKTRTRFHLLFLEVAMITRFVAISLAVFSPNCFTVPMQTAGFAINCVSAVLVLVCFILMFPVKFRNNTPPYVYLGFIGVTGLFAIPEIVLYGLAGFKSDKQDHKEQIFVAAMAYVVASLAFSMALFIALIFWSPMYEASDKQDVEKQEKQDLSRRGKSSKRIRSRKERENSESSKRRNVPGSNRSQRSNRSYRTFDVQ